MKNMKKTLLTVISMILILLFLVGCKFGPGSDGDDINSLADRNFRSGSQGIEMEWLFEDIPDVVYDTGAESGEIILLVEVRNEGAEDSDHPEFYLSGFDQTFVGLPYTDARWNQKLDGRSIRNEEGGFRVIQIPHSSDMGCGDLRCQTVHLPPGIPSYRPIFKFTACYPYTTKASPVVCVDPNPYSLTAEKACNPEQVDNLGGSQGAPVAVTSVRVENIEDEVIFRIEVQNVGNGRVIDSGALGSCPGDLTYDQNNVVEFDINFQGEPITGFCQPDNGVITLHSDRGVIVCDNVPIRGDSNNAFMTPLLITLNYGYTSSIEHQLEIKRLKTT